MGNHGGDLAYSNDYDNPELGSGVSGSFLDNNQNLNYNSLAAQTCTYKLQPLRPLDERPCPQPLS
jgi:hypothetical protein